MTDQPGTSDAGQSGASDDPAGPLDFDPYRFGKPDHPIPPEYAPPGYVPPAQPTPAGPGPVWPPKDPPSPAPGYGQQPYPPPYGGHPPASGGYGGYTPHPPPPPGYPAYGQVRPSNGKATTAMVLGILSVLFFWLTVLDLALAIPAIVLGALAVRDAKRFPEREGRGKGLAGLICGIVAIVLIIVAVAVVYVRIKPCLDYGLNSDRYQSCLHDRL
jgi:hypothetical protein